jgi:type VI secretion system protein ImpE
MIAEEALKAADVEKSLAGLQDDVRRAPADAKKRVFLFQLLTVLGRWDRALAQLDVIGELDASALPMVFTYRDAVRCEPLREKVFAGQTSPLVFGDPQRWVALMVEALRLEAQHAYAEAWLLRDEAFAAAPATAGHLNAEPFDWIADADPRLGPMLEVVLEGRYCWVPWMHVSALRLSEPEDLRDLVWMPGEFTWSHGGTAVGLIPTRYVGSAAAADDRIRLARRTEWQEPSPGSYSGLGQRMFATDRGEYPLLEVRRVDLSPALPREGGGDSPVADG